jgi:hypothetical protein
VKPRRRAWWPASRAGRAAAGIFVALFALTQPPLVFWIANRIEPRILGLPFLFAWLLAVYLLLIGVLLLARRRGL